jgi:hypothetical protein
MDSTQIKFENEKSVLIEIPQGYGFDEYKFWYPKKFINKVENYDKKQLFFGFYKDNFIFILKKYNKKFKVEYEHKLTANEFTFKLLICNYYRNRIESQEKIKKERIIHVPIKIKLKDKMEVCNDLLDD